MEQTAHLCTCRKVQIVAFHPHNKSVFWVLLTCKLSWTYTVVDQVQVRIDQRVWNDLQRTRLFCLRMIWLISHPLSQPFPVNKLDSDILYRKRQDVGRRWGEGGGGAKSYDGERAWSSINHSIRNRHSHLQFRTPTEVGPKIPASLYVSKKVVSPIYLLSSLWVELNSEAESKEKHGVWDPMQELTITSPYVYSRVDSNTFTIGNPMP